MDEQAAVAICDTPLCDANPATPADHCAVSPDWACFWGNRPDEGDKSKRNSLTPAVSIREDS
jgi:hypothetical protein